MPGRPDWGGTALAGGQNVILEKVAVTVAEGASVTYDAIISRPGYTIRLETQNQTNSTTQLPVRIDLEWSDSTSGTILDHQSWCMFAGDTASYHSVSGKGPTQGDGLSVTITNKAASAVTLLFNLYIAEVTASFPRHDWRTDDYSAFSIAGWTEVVPDMIAGIAGGRTLTSQAAGNSTTLLLPLYCGRVRIAGGTASGGANYEIDVNQVADKDITSGVGPLFALVADTTGHINGDAWLPRAQCEIVLTNKATVAEETNYAVILSEY